MPKRPTLSLKKKLKPFYAVVRDKMDATTGFKFRRTHTSKEEAMRAARVMASQCDVNFFVIQAVAKVTPDGTMLDAETV